MGKNLYPQIFEGELYVAGQTLRYQQIVAPAIVLGTAALKSNNGSDNYQVFRVGDAGSMPKQGELLPAMNDESWGHVFAAAKEFGIDSCSGLYEVQQAGGISQYLGRYILAKMENPVVASGDFVPVLLLVVKPDQVFCVAQGEAAVQQFTKFAYPKMVA